MTAGDLPERTAMLGLKTDAWALTTGQPLSPRYFAHLSSPMPISQADRLLRPRVT
jgi:hypothetical protein